MAAEAGCSKDDDDEEEREYLVYLVFDGMVDSELLSKPDVHFKLIGAETEQPIMQLGSQVFAGEYRDTTGTAVFFEEIAAAKRDPVFAPKLKHELKYMCKTRKALHMTRVFLNKKKAGEENPAEQEESAKVTEPQEQMNTDT